MTNKNDDRYANYYAAEAADAAYSATIRRLFGERATRWTLTVEQERHPEYRAVRDAKIAADNALSAEMEARRG